MSQHSHDADDRALSVVIPAYDAAPWLPDTLDALATALERAPLRAEVVVVDDGSTDGTREVLERYAASFPVPLRVIAQPNRGRFLARWEGVSAARYPTVLLLDARVVLDPDAMEYLVAHPEVRAWNGHVRTDPATALVGRFWEVPTSIFWRHYLADPRPVDIEPAGFDRVPKGTGCLVISREAYLRAAREEWPDASTAHLVSDDTRLLRRVVSEQPLRLDPGFAATYRPRTTVAAFLRHAFGRGTLFVDSYAGTGVTRDVALIALILAPPVAAGAMIWMLVAGAWIAALAVLAVILASLGAVALVARACRCPSRAVAAYVLYVIPFGAVFWAGLVRGAIVHRRAFGGGRTTLEDR